MRLFGANEQYANGGSSEMMRSVTNMPLPRTLPDKLDWAHEAYKRLWSAPGPAVDDLPGLQGRMHALRCRLVARGIGSAPVELGGSCPNPFTPVYVPPY